MASTRALPPYLFEIHCQCRTCDWHTPPGAPSDWVLTSPRLDGGTTTWTDSYAPVSQRWLARDHAKSSGHQVEVVESWVRAYAPAQEGGTP